MKNLEVAVIGAGTSGMAVSILLKKSGHDVTLFEKFSEPKPLGAGLLLQPSGLSVLSVLGLDKKIIELGCKVNQLLGKEVHKDFEVLNTRYSSIGEHLFGVGTHRGNLFTVLYKEVLKNKIKVVTGTNIVEISATYEGSKSNKKQVVGGDGKSLGEFNIVVDASGAKSILRDKYADVRLNKPYPFGALWGIVKDEKGHFSDNCLNQRFKNAHHMIGTLPVGIQKSDNVQSLAFFWSMKVADYAEWKQGDFKKWQDYVILLWPETEYLVKQFKSHDDLTFASYNDVILKQYHTDNIVFIGDAAHCTSPQLGQGANLALLDAYFLSKAINDEKSIKGAFTSYTEQRKGSIKFYQMASRFLTPYFQSDSLLFAKLRLLTCSIPCKVPITQKYGAKVLTGTKTGVFTSLNPGDWAKDYHV